MKMNSFTLTTIVLLVLLASCKENKTIHIREDFKKFYLPYKLEGCFILLDDKKNEYTIYNEALTKEAVSPASTFKICNSLIGLETGIIKDEHTVFKWDGVMKGNPKWNSDQDLKTAIRNSTVWYYQELARRIGRKKMKYWLDKAEYGNRDTTGGIDRFWLSGGLRISPEAQIHFLKKLHDDKLPFSKKNMQIVKNIMIVKDTLDFVIHAKTGWASGDQMDLGWFVGYAESEDNVFYFANCIQSKNLDNPDFGKARIEIVYKILAEMGILRN